MAETHDESLDLDKELDNLLGDIEGGEGEQPERKPVEDPEKVIASLNAQRKHWRKKAQELQAQNAGKTETKPAQSQPTKPAEGNSQYATREDLEVLQLQNQGFDAETISAIRSYAKGKGVSATEVLGDEFVKSFIDAKKSKSRLETAAPEPSARTMKINGKTWEEMTPDERKVAYPERMRKILERNARR